MENSEIKPFELKMSSKERKDLFHAYENLCETLETIGSVYSIQGTYDIRQIDYTSICNLLSEYYSELSKVETSDEERELFFSYHFKHNKCDNTYYINQRLLLDEVIKNCDKIIKDFKEYRELNSHPTLQTYKGYDSFFRNSSSNITSNHFVYIGTSNNHPNEYKIGVSKDMEQRVNSLKTGCPKYNIIASLNTKDRNISYKIESMLHSYYEEYCIDGEWFNLSSQDIEFIINSFGFNKPLEA